MTPYRKKLIEVALPLEDINRESAREKSIRHGHPSTLHLWWARRPLAACRAVLFSSLVDDPDSDPQFRKPDGTLDVDRASGRRAELFDLIKEFVKWENSNNPKIINTVRAEIAACIASRHIYDTQEWTKDQTICREKAWTFACRLAKPENVNEFLMAHAPPVLDPFCGGGSIPLEAQRLGLRAFGSDLNPVPVLITKALIEIPPKFANMPPVNPGSNARLKDGWKGAQGLAEDVRYYGQWMRDQAEKRIGHLYPKVKITEEMIWGVNRGSAFQADSARGSGVPPDNLQQSQTPRGAAFQADNLSPFSRARCPTPIRPDLEPYLGEELTVIAWLWARTVASPNPAVGGAHVPLVRSFWLSTKKGKEAWVEPIIDRETNSYRFEVRIGTPPEGIDPGKGTIGRKGGRCILSESPMPFTHVRAQGKAGQMSQRLMAIVAEGTRGRVYLSPLPSHAEIANSAHPSWKPDCQLPIKHRNFQTPAYGMPNVGDLFTPRQLTALTTFSDLVKEAREKVLTDIRGSGVSPDKTSGERATSSESPPSDTDADGGQDGRPPQDSSGGRASCPTIEVNDTHRPDDQFPKGFYRRGEKHPPHFDQPGKMQHVTFRLAGSLPAEYLARAKQELASGTITSDQYREKLEAELDRGHGPDWLARSDVADIIESAVKHFDGQRYHLHTWCIMPNHVHVLFMPCAGESLASIVHSWKSFTAKKCNALLARTGIFWQDDYFDRYMRDHTDVRRTSNYIMNNGGRASCPTIKYQEKRTSTPTLSEKHGGQDGRPPFDATESYADAVATYLAFAVDKCTNYWSSLCGWHSGREIIMSTFGRQALPMVWDYAEANPMSESSGNFFGGVEQAARLLAAVPAGASGIVRQISATNGATLCPSNVISTDPPYYDNIGYADLSDFFYVWLRRSLGDIYPDLFKTLLTPKADELIATPYRHGGDKHKAQKFFENGLGDAFHRMHEMQPPEYPMTVFYAFKQSEDTEEESGGGGHPGRQEELMAGETPAPQASPHIAPQLQASTGWETMLAGLIDSGFAITGTWPMRTELVGNLKKNISALASSIVLSCRPRSADAPVTTRREFLSALKRELPDALRHLQQGNIAPVDLAQASIGPGMAIYTRYAKVLEADGSAMAVRSALAAINQTLDEVLAEQEGEFDPDTRWAVAWFEQFGMEEGPFGQAETLSRAKNTAVNGLVESGIILARAGKVRLLNRSELLPNWNPATDKRCAHWEIAQYLIRAHDTAGESAAADLLRQLGTAGEIARDLAYRLYNICERKKWPAEALAYNSLVIAWPEIAQLARKEKVAQTQERKLF